MKIEAHQQRAADRYNAGRREFVYKKGDLVLVRRLTRAEKGTSTKFNARYKGPFYITAALEGNTYTVRMKGRTVKYHADQLKMFFEREKETV